MTHPRIEICGGIGSGKTTLAMALREHAFNPILEQFRDTQFYEAFYENPQMYAFETEIDFLLQHYHLIKRNRHLRASVCDYSFWLDHAYAKTNLSANKLRVFQEVWNEILAEIAYPVLVIALECEAEVLQRRITLRAREEEAGITVEYLSGLNCALADELGLLARTTAVLEIRSDQFDFRPTSENSSSLMLALKSKMDELACLGKVGRYRFSPRSGSRGGVH